jgi:uncharacterized protein with NRDE domain
VCLIALAWRLRDDLPLVVAANRDEFYDRPTRAAHAWDDAPHVLGGRDLRAGGGWLTAAGGGRFAAVTNIRYAQVEGGPSRGALVADFIRGNDDALVFLERLAPHASGYAGFHLIVGDGRTLAHFSNADAHPSVLPPGIFGISNAPPGVEWPKVALARDAVAHALRAPEANAVAEELLAFLTTPRGSAVESEVFVGLPERGYGTRASTVVLVDAAGDVVLRERAGGVTTSLAAAAARSR